MAENVTLNADFSEITGILNQIKNEFRSFTLSFQQQNARNNNIAQPAAQTPTIAKPKENTVEEQQRIEKAEDLREAHGRFRSHAP